MNRQHNTDKSSVDLFVGREVEKTPAHNMPTLFVAGLQPIADIEDSVLSEKHIFFGADHTFNNPTPEEFENWEAMINHFLKQGFLCTLDFGLDDLALIQESVLVEDINFIPQIRVPIPYIQTLPYNTMLKIDDTEFQGSNPGVWCHRLHDLMATDKFTPWREYLLDIPL